MYENDIWAMELGTNESWDSSSVLKAVSDLAMAIKPEGKVWQGQSF